MIPRHFALARRIHQQKRAGETTVRCVGQTDAMVIEELHFIVEPNDQAEFLAIEGDVWTGFLRSCDGFVRKETWVPIDDPSRIIVIIWWATMAQWKCITPAQCDEVDARMGKWLRPVAFVREHNVVVVAERSADAASHAP